ncbi:MAG: endonuclease/exonuclease/phosphatase family protein [Bacteroidetes bacterium]|nr:endonuclease/exonuclease/phosphatase family protein [Bacteroidota bacterium]
MASAFRRFVKKTAILCNCILAVIFLLACLAPYLNPEKWWFISILGLGFPFLLAGHFLFLIFWLFVKRKFIFISLITMLIGWKSISLLFAFHQQVRFDYKKPADRLRIVTWNVARFIELKKNNNEGSQTRLKMMELIKEQNADVVCLQEIHTSIAPAYYNNIEYIQKELGYPYFYFTWELDVKDHWYSSIIFSRLPMIDTGRVYYPKPGITEVLLRADLKFNNDTIRLFNTHLQSVLFEKTDYDKIESLEHGDEGFVGNSKGILSKVKKGAIIRGRQADKAREIISQSPYPVLFTGDLNDVPTSYTYSTIRGDMQDAFLQKGLGMGRTFTSLSPTLRIDYIFADKNFSILQYKKYNRDLSDHYMQVADIKLLNPHP